MVTDHLPKTEPNFKIEGNLDEKGNFIPTNKVRVIYNPAPLKSCCKIFLTVAYTICGAFAIYIFYQEFFK